MRPITAAQIEDRAKTEALKPTESVYENEPGFQRTYREDGSYTWTCDVSLEKNMNGVSGYDALVDDMTPFIRADERRFGQMSAMMEREQLRAQDGSIQFIDPGMAGVTARRNGWRHVWRAGGATVRLGTDGRMLWRYVGGWLPTGRRCLGTPLVGKAEVPKTGICYYDPDGQPWRWKRGEWRRT
jgi:hypothetical protein